MRWTRRFRPTRRPSPWSPTRPWRACTARARQAALARTGKRVLRIELPDGEAHKDWQTLNLIFDALLENRLDRRAVLVALGGG